MIIDFINLGFKLLDRVVPDPKAKAEAQMELMKLAQTGELKALDAELQLAAGQIEVNKAEAANANWFVSGWRPAVGWVCVLGLLYTFLVRPLLTFFVHSPAPEIDTGTLVGMLTGLLGVGGLRTIEKLNGVSRS